MLYCTNKISDIIDDNIKKTASNIIKVNNLLNDVKPYLDVDKKNVVNAEIYKSRKNKNTIVPAKNNKKLRIHCNIDANFGKAIEIHVIMIYDNEIKNMFKSMSLKDYKKNYNMILRENSKSIEVFKLEVIPGKSHEQQIIPINDKMILIDCIAFAFIMNRDVMPIRDKEMIPSDDVIRKIVIGNQEIIDIILKRSGIFIR